MSELKKTSGVDFEVRWHPYQLNPNAPKEGQNKLQMYQDKFGAARVAQMLPQMTKVYSDLGLNYSIGGLTGNTLDSHRLIYWAGQQGGAEVQNSLVEELFKNYFTEEKYINDRTVLVAAAEKVGLQGAAEYLMDPNNGLKEVQEEMADMARGVSGVPHFTISDRYVLSGAQDPSTFVQAFKKVLEERKA
ncbi:hypothetical protein CEUSTIGMA_g1344.t1 [Chlamydomonas eustigma]|uniref:DSBA-like thioredoxin domain-containing protein n=1 Tax=Chlamydomonas eustigma TaxID=1157962 RepID=A0A250WST4_9CHLO|nr:hypothetical protein CEUSTIGMA_g1344.t1 [Chlamydomonas eustigma]|eukprot:GAX73894.1 hypothetical protein CEUSTIGMA_g1344.t1 [Chlamydomonas eustigma]